MSRAEGEIRIKTTQRNKRQPDGPVAIAKLKGSIGLNDPGQRELLKLCLSLSPIQLDDLPCNMFKIQSSAGVQKEQLFVGKQKLSLKLTNNFACEATSLPWLTKSPSQFSYKVSCTSSDSRIIPSSGNTPGSYLFGFLPIQKFG